jgi:hypothetical protein
MKKQSKDERIIFIATGLLLLSILLLIAIIPGIFNDTYHNANAKGAVFGVSLAIVFRFIIIGGYIKIIKDTRRSGKKSKGAYIAIGILLIVFGLISMDGAFAFLYHKDIPHVSILMFTSVIFDFMASILTFLVLFIKPKKSADNANIN